MPGKKVPGITTSAAPTEAVPDMCETTIRDKHVAINEKGLVVDDQRMDDRKTIPLEGARQPSAAAPARARSRTRGRREGAGGGLAHHRLTHHLARAQTLS